MQSFILADFFPDKSESTAISALNMAVVPFYAFSAFGLIFKLASDKIGHNMVIIFTLLTLLAGCILCLKTSSLIGFLAGTGLITLATSVDMQYLYVVSVIPEERRAAVRGILGALATFSAMMIPVFRRLYGNWRNIYLPPVILTVSVIVIIALFTRFSKENQRLNYCTEPTDNPRGGFESVLKNRISLRRYLVLYMLFGVGTAGITLYNEPLVKFSGTDESGMFAVLFVQPVVLMVMTLLGGVLGDHVSRVKAIILNSILSIISLAAFLLLCGSVSALYSGILWGMMTALYYNAEAMFQLMILESAGFECIGRTAALSTCFYGVGDGIGMILANLLTKEVGISAAKFMVCVPILIFVSAMLIFFDNMKCTVSQ
jgi:predicted MFS family arabinose efflux permease